MGVLPGELQKYPSWSSHIQPLPGSFHPATKYIFLKHTAVIPRPHWKTVRSFPQPTKWNLNCLESLQYPSQSGLSLFSQPPHGWASHYHWDAFGLAPSTSGLSSCPEPHCHFPHVFLSQGSLCPPHPPAEIQLFFLHSPWMPCLSIPLDKSITSSLVLPYSVFTSTIETTTLYLGSELGVPTCEQATIPLRSLR